MDFVVEFLKFYKTIEHLGRDDFVNLYPLKETIGCMTPVSLPYSNVDVAFSNMPGVVVVNFSKCCKTTIRKYGLEALKKIITKNIADEDTKVQLMLMVHVTKLNLVEPELSYASMETTTCEIDVTATLNSWLNMANKVLEHSEVKKVIDELMKETFGDEYTQRIAEANGQNVAVNLINSDEVALRGFSGINIVYINERYFRLMAYELNCRLARSAIEKENIALIDIATVCLHELSHIKIRQVFDNLNFSTPKVMVNKPNSDEHEFGRITENRFFGEVVSWKRSYQLGRVPMDYVKNFIDALNANSALPPIPTGTEFIRRGGSTMQVCGGGVDLDFEPNFSIC